jgi:IS1 family transposase
MELYDKVKERIQDIACIFTDANSCYDVAFRRYNIPEPHIMTKRETHLIESSNSSIRDNLARFNRRSKRFSKCWKMLDLSLNLFFNRHKLNLTV